MTTDDRPSTLSSVLRFLAVGGSNTVITLVLFALLARVMAPWLAYSLVFVVGMAYTTILTGRFVFGADNTRRRSGLLIGWYLAVFVIGLGVVQTVQALGVDSPDILALLTVAVTAPLNFLGGRWIFRDRSSHSEKKLVS
jgi:putative flippase GtrA